MFSVYQSSPYTDRTRRRLPRAHRHAGQIAPTNAPFAALLVLWPEVNAPHLTDCGTPASVAGGAVETYPAGLAVAYLDKLSLP